MKALRLLIVGLLASAAVCRAQYLAVTNSGWLTMASVDALAVTNDYTDDDPVQMEKVTENLAKLSESVTSIADGLAKGEGTIGKLLKNDAVYNNLEGFTDKLNKGEGTLGKLMTDDTVYKNFEAFSEDIKRHPWKLLARPRGE